MRRFDAPVSFNVRGAQATRSILDHCPIKHHVDSRKVADAIKDRGILQQRKYAGEIDFESCGKAVVNIERYYLARPPLS